MEESGIRNPFVMKLEALTGAHFTMTREGIVLSEDNSRWQRRTADVLLKHYNILPPKWQRDDALLIPVQQLDRNLSHKLDAYIVVEGERVRQLAKALPLLNNIVGSEVEREGMDIARFVFEPNNKAIILSVPRHEDTKMIHALVERDCIYVHQFLDNSRANPIGIYTVDLNALQNLNMALRSAVHSIMTDAGITLDGTLQEGPGAKRTMQ